MQRLGFICAAVMFLGSAALHGQVKATESPKAIVVANGDKPILTYHSAVIQPPKGADPAYARSGFIHPIHTPSGGVVTGIHPGDHYHHLGIWHAWVKAKHNGRDLDFWNLKKKNAAVRFAKTGKIHNGKDGAGFTVTQEHVALVEGKDPQVILSEQFTILVRHENGANVIDHTTVQTNVTDAPLELPAYRYGGPLAYRGPASWNKTNSDYLTSEGKTRVDGHATRGKWCAMWGPTKKGIATLAILCHPKNHDAPQRMRIWPAKINNGAIFFNYVPIQEAGWKLEPNKPSTMRYRLIASDGKPDAEKIQKLWDAFAKE
jgi:hypothetical protein